MEGKGNICTESNQSAGAPDNRSTSTRRFGLRGVLAGVALSLVASSAGAAPTHLGVGHGRLVHLEAVDTSVVTTGCSQFDKALRVVRPNGAVDTKEFVVPAGQELIITDISWEARPRDFDDWLPDRAANVVLELRDKDGSLVKSDFFRTSSVDTRAGTKAVVGTVEALAGGLRVGSRRTLCIGGYEAGGTGNLYGRKVFNLRNASVLGYFVTR